MTNYPLWDALRHINSQNMTSKQIRRFEILSQLIPSSKQTGRIEIITTASSKPIEVNKIYKKAFNKIGFNFNVKKSKRV